ncbi:MAG: hypothetical protein Q9169_008571 [Polycauliona sp. 2 TL-2023]
MASFVYSSTDAFVKFASRTKNNGQALAAAEHCCLKVLEWPNDGNLMLRWYIESEFWLLLTAAQTARIFAPLDYPGPQNGNGVQALFSHFNIPTEFAAERINSVTHSFGWHQEEDADHGTLKPLTSSSCRSSGGTTVIWLHTLCKNLTLVRGIDGSPSIQDPRGSQPSQESDGTWLRSGIFLRWKQPIAGDDDASDADLIIFSPTISLQRNLEILVKRANWRQALEDPFCLLVIVLDDLCRQVDEAATKVHSVIGSVEHVGHLRLVTGGHD